MLQKPMDTGKFKLKEACLVAKVRVLLTRLDTHSVEYVVKSWESLDKFDVGNIKSRSTFIIYLTMIFTTRTNTGTFLSDWWVDLFLHFVYGEEGGVSSTYRTKFYFF